MTTPMATAAATLITHVFDDDHVEPRPGQIVKLRFPNPVAGPDSIASFSAPTKSTYTSTWRTAVIVLCAERFGTGFLITAMPMPAFSREPDPVAWMASQPASFRDSHLPVPISPAAATTDSRVTPPEFGPPLTMGGFQDRMFSWVQAWPQSFTLKYSDKWKSYQPSYQCERAELIRLSEYADVVAPFNPLFNPSASITSDSTTVLASSSASASPGNPAIYRAAPPEDNHVLRSVFAHLGQPYYVLNAGVYDDDDTDDDSDEDDCPDDLATMVRLWPNPHPVALHIVEVEKRKRLEANKKDTQRWLESLDDFRGTEQDYRDDYASSLVL